MLDCRLVAFFSSNSCSYTQDTCLRKAVKIIQTTPIISLFWSEILNWVCYLRTQVLSKIIDLGLLDTAQGSLLRRRLTFWLIIIIIIIIIIFFSWLLIAPSQSLGRVCRPSSDLSDK